MQFEGCAARFGMLVTERSWSSTWKKSDSLKVEVEELESLLGPEESEVDFRRTFGSRSEEQKSGLSHDL